MQIEKGVDKIVKTIRLMILDQPGYLGRVATAVGNAGGNITDLHLVSYGVEYNTRDLTLFIDDEAQLQEVLAEIGKVEGVIISEIIDPVLEMHRGGKIQVKSRVPLDGLATLRKIYTPGVAKVCRLIQQTPELAHEYTAIGNTVAIITNGTAILGLGDIGPVAGMPVMEGKAVLFDALVGINGVPILLANDKQGRLALCKYVLRPPLANDRLAIIDADHVRLDFKKPWSDGTTSVEIAPLALIARLAALVPPPRRHLTGYFGVLSSHSSHRSQCVPAPVPESTPEQEDKSSRTLPLSHYISWSELLRRTFEIDTICPRCKSPLRLIALIKTDDTIKKILSAMGLPTEAPKPYPARPPPSESGGEGGDWLN